ncbi:MAG: efflux RND transporter permease subunit, partial [Fusobacteriaceae bacterium]
IITTNWEGATAEQVANLVSKKIEQEVRTMESLDYIYSKNVAGQSNVYVNLKAKYWTTFEQWQELINKINNFVVLPPTASKPIINIYFGNVYGTVLSISSNTVPYEKLYEYSEQLKKEMFFSVPQIAEIKIFGRQQESIYIEIDNDKLVESGITIGEITKNLQQANLLSDGGTIQYRSDRIIVNPSGTFDNISQIGEVVLYGAQNKGRVALKDVATIRKGYIEPSNLKTFNKDQKSVVVAIALRKGENILKLKDEAEKVVTNFRNTLPLGVDINFVYNQGSIVNDKIAGFVSSLIQAIVVIVAVMFLFLGMRTGLIVASLTPTTIAVTLIGIKVFGYGINQMTLAGLIIALGMLVDNAIVMSESIMVLCQKGMERKEACLTAAKSLAVSLFTGSATTCVAMIPIIANREMMGQYVGPMAIVVFIALSASWIINQTFIPLVCYDFINPNAIKPVDFNKEKMYVFYRTFLIGALKGKYLTIIVAVGTFFLGVFLFMFIPKNFLPVSDNPTMSTYIRMPKGTSIETTEQVIADLNKYIKEKYYVGDIKPKPPTILDYVLTGGTSKVYEKEGILTWESYVGNGGPKFSLIYTPEISLPEYAYILLKVTDYKLIPKFSGIINTYLQSKYPDIVVTSKGLDTGMTFEWDLSYVFVSPDKKVLESVKNEVMEKLRQTEGVRLVNEIAGNKVPQVVANIDYNKAQLAGISTSQIADAIRYSLKGTQATIFYDFNAPPESTMIPILIKGTKDYKDKLQLLGSIVLQDAQGRKVPLQQVATLELVHDSNFVYKRDMEDAIVVNASADKGYTGILIDAKIRPWVEKRMKETWSAKGVKFALTDGLKNAGDNRAGLMAPIPISFLIMAIIVIMQFNSIKKGMIIMMTIPLVMLGCAIGLIITRLDFGFMAIVGIISLAGVIINQAVVMIDKIQTLEVEYDGDIYNAIVCGCQERLRPILLTTYTTLAGLMPLYFFGGPLFQPLAAVLIFGLMIGTILTLVVIPVLYSTVFHISFQNYKYEGMKGE